MSLYFTKNDEWARVNGQTARLGLTAAGAEHLGDVTFVELPKIGQTVVQGQPVCAVEAVKAAVDYYAPLSGTVTAVNQALKAKPELINSSPLEEGWIAEISLNAPAEVAALLDEAGYQAFLAAGEA